MDELALLWDEELAQLDPDALPRRLVTDFSVYNAEVGAEACVAATADALLLKLSSHQLQAMHAAYISMTACLMTLAKRSQPAHPLHHTNFVVAAAVVSSSVVCLFSHPHLTTPQGFMTTLELLPMWAGVDPDVEVFVSGVVKDDDGDWGVGGQGLGQDEPQAEAPKPAETDTGAGGSGGSGSGSGSADAGASGAAPEAAPEAADPVMVGGTRMFLSQLREWVVEYSADQLFLSIRTDAGWYRLCRWGARSTWVFASNHAVVALVGLPGNQATEYLAKGNP